MLKIISAVLLVSALLLNDVSTAVAAAPDRPQGECPRGFRTHDAEMHDTQDHQHAGLKVDLNDDGKICVKHLGEEEGDTHVHVDNFVRPR